MTTPNKLDCVLEPGEPKLLATGFHFTEGPLWQSPSPDHPDGALYVSDVDDAIHYLVDARTGEKEMLRENDGGANGATYDLQGRVVWCEQDVYRVVQREHDGSWTVLAAEYNGVRLNRSNDVVGRSDGSLYFSDPQFLMDPDDRLIGTSSVFRIDPEGALHQAGTDMPHPNGLAFSPDELLLYVSNTRPNPHMYVYEVAADGSLSNGREFAEMPYVPGGPDEGDTFIAHSGAERPIGERGGVPDGLKVDTSGRVFSTGPGGCWVWEPDGEFLGVIETPELPANVGWGGIDFKTLYLTCRTSVYSLRVKTPGTPVPGMPAANN